MYGKYVKGSGTPVCNGIAVTESPSTPGVVGMSTVWAHNLY